MSQREVIICQRMLSTLNIHKLRKMLTILAQYLVDNQQQTICTLDLSSRLQTDYQVTFPVCLISFINLKKDQLLDLSANVSSHVLIVMQGAGESRQ